MIDFTAKRGVEIRIRQDGLVIWIDVDGICVYRIITNGFIPIDVTDNRNRPVEKPHLSENI